MIKENNFDHSKPDGLYYSVTRHGMSATAIGDTGKFIHDHSYLINTNDETPQDKYEQIEEAIFNILNPAH